MKLRALRESARAKAKELQTGWARKRDLNRMVLPNKKISSMLAKLKKVEDRMNRMRDRFNAMERHEKKDRIMFSEFIWVLRDYVKLHEKINEGSIKVAYAAIKFWNEHGVPPKDLIVRFPGKTRETKVREFAESIQHYEERRGQIKKYLSLIERVIVENDFEGMEKLLLNLDEILK